MLTDELKDRGHQLVQELDLEPHDSTEKWMAHYIVELMERAQNASSTEERSQAADRCAQIIMRLWERRAEKTVQYVRSRVYSSFEAIYERKELADTLQVILEAPTEQTYPRDWETRSILLWHLTDVERDLLRLLIIANTIDAMDDDGAVDDAIKEFIEEEERTSTIRRHLEDVFPGMRGLDLRNRRSVVRRVRSAFQSIHTARERLI